VKKYDKTWRRNEMMKFLIAATAAATLLSSTALAAVPASTGHQTTTFGPPGAPSPGVFWDSNSGFIPDDTTTATPTVTHSFVLTGTVNKDCSFANSGATSHTVPLGTIGVRNGDNEPSTTLFNQANDFGIEIQSTSAGCNFNNTVTVAKSALGLQHTGPASGFDNTAFTDHIPYSVVVGITSATTNQTGGAVGTFTAMTVAANAASNTETLGAWRTSLFDMKAIIPAQSLGLVAGDYTDTITVTLTAL
jgi:hypothetical protein